MRHAGCIAEIPDLPAHARDPARPGRHGRGLVGGGPQARKAGRDQAAHHASGCRPCRPGGEAAGQRGTCAQTTLPWWADALAGTGEALGIGIAASGISTVPADDGSRNVGPALLNGLTLSAIGNRGSARECRRDREMVSLNRRDNGHARRQDGVPGSEGRVLLADRPTSHPTSPGPTRSPEAQADAGLRMRGWFSSAHRTVFGGRPRRVSSWSGVPRYPPPPISRVSVLRCSAVCGIAARAGSM